MKSITDKEFARWIAIGLSNAKVLGGDAGVVIDHLAHLGDDEKLVKDYISKYYGLDFYDEIYWKSYDFVEI